MNNGYEWFWADYERAILAVLRAGPAVLDVGTPEAFRKDLAHIRLPQPAPRIWTLDYPSYGSRSVSVFGDACQLPFEDATFNGVICKDVLEHVREPQTAAEELVRVLRPGGVLFATLAYMQPYHAHNTAYGDYWRFARDACQLLFRSLDVDVLRAGGWAFVARSYAPSVVSRLMMSRAATSILNVFDQLVPTRNISTMYLVTARKPAS